MGKFLKFAIGVAVLGVVGLVGLSVMSIVAALVLGRAASHQVVAGVEVPARTVEVSGIERSVYDTFNAPAEVSRSVQTNWSLPAQVQVNVRDSWIDVAGAFAGGILFLVVISILAVVIRSVRRGRATIPSDDTALVHELARRAQEMSQRMESLETILLDRTRAAR